MENERKFLKDFKTFLMRGNVLDMAVGVIIGGAFSKIVSSLVNDVIMPLLGLLVGEVSFAELKWVIREAVVAADGAIVAEAVSINYGRFLQYVIDFLLVAFCIFMAVRVISGVVRRFKKAEERQEPEPQPSKEKLLLTEIRDLLRDR